MPLTRAPGGRPYQQREIPPPAPPRKPQQPRPGDEPEYEGETYIEELPNGRQVEWVATRKPKYDPATKEWNEELTWVRGNPYNAPRDRQDAGVAAGISAGSREREGAANRAQRDEEVRLKAEQDEEDRRSREAIAALNAQIDKLQLDETQAHNRATEERDKGNLEESKRQFDLSNTLAVKRHILENAKFDWEKKSFEVTSGLEEQRNRIQEAQVTGYYS